MLDPEAAGSEQVFEMLNGVFVTVFRVNPLTLIELHLESACRQSVRIDALDMTLQFDQGERIHTENSYKYTIEHLENLLRSGGFQVEHTWTDPDSWFAVSLGVIT